MKKLLSILVLVVLATPAFGDVLLDLTAPAYGSYLTWHLETGWITYDCMYIDLIIHDLQGHTETVGGFGARLTLDGADAARFTGAGEVCRDSAGGDLATWPMEYAFESWGVAIVSEGAAGYVGFGHNSATARENVPFTALAPGDIVARFCFFDSDWMAPITDLTFTLQTYANLGDYAIFTLADAQTDVRGYLIPEPATMGLLGLGLLGLVARRKK